MARWFQHTSRNRLFGLSRESEQLVAQWQVVLKAEKDRNRRRPAWENGLRLITNNICVHGVKSEHRNPLSFKPTLFLGP
jgi:hypothetical protein